MATLPKAMKSTQLQLEDSLSQARSENASLEQDSKAMETIQLQLKDYLSQVRSEKASLEQDAKTTETKLVEANARNDELQHQLQAMKSTQLQLEDSLSQVRRENASLEQGSTAKETIQLQLTDYLSQVKSEKASLEQDAKELKDELKAETETRAKEKELYETNESSLKEALEESKEKLKAEIKTRAMEKDSYETKETRLRAELAQTKQRVVEEEKTVKIEKKKVAAAKDNLSTEKKKLTATKNEFREAQKEIENMKGDLKKLSNERDRANKTAETALKDLQFQRDEIERTLQNRDETHNARLKQWEQYHLSHCQELEENWLKTYKQQLEEHKIELLEAIATREKKIEDITTRSMEQEKEASLYASSTFQASQKQLEKTQKDARGLESNIKELNTKIKALQTQITKYKADEKLQAQREAVLIKRVNSDSQQLQSIRSQLQIAESDKQQKHKHIVSLESQVQELQHRLLRHKKEIEDISAERHDLTVRLSEVAPAKLTKGNTAIADLSDENRPTKLAEMYFELYDNQWTDAYEELAQDSSETDSIDQLLDILKLSFQACFRIAETNLDDLRMTLKTFRCPKMDDLGTKAHLGTSVDPRSDQGPKPTVKPPHQQSDPGEDGTDVDKAPPVTDVDKSDEHSETTKSVERKIVADSETDIPTETWHRMVQIRKQNAYDIREEVPKMLLEKFKTTLQLESKPDTAAFMAECCRVCWLMALQDPPVVIDISRPSRDGTTPFDKDKYRAYTKTGPHLTYIVWPALYLHKGGSLLAKGVAEGAR